MGRSKLLVPLLYIQFIRQQDHLSITKNKYFLAVTSIHVCVLLKSVTVLLSMVQCWVEHPGNYGSDILHM